MGVESTQASFKLNAKIFVVKDLLKIILWDKVWQKSARL